MKIGIITQARVGSTRLSAKILKTVEGKSILSYHLERLKASGFPVYLATTREPGVEDILGIAESLAVPFFQGDEAHVLSRFYECAKKFQLDHVVRVTSDCPLIDGDLIRTGVQQYEEGLSSLPPNKEFLYFSNCLQRTYPRGFDFEIFSFKALEQAFQKATRDQDKEHVTPFLYSEENSLVEKKHFKRFSEEAARFRLTLDTPEDFELLSLLMEKYACHQKGVEEIIRVMQENPWLERINGHIEQKKLAPHSSLKQLYFRVDGGDELGMGHVTRCLALGEMVKDHFSLHFLLGAQSKSLVPLLEKATLLPEFSSPLEEAVWLTQKISRPSGPMVLDGYSFDVSYQKILKEAGWKVICLEDYSKGLYGADAILAPTTPPSRSGEFIFTGTSSKVFSGPDYVCLRPSFLSRAGHPPAFIPNQGKISEKRILITMGGADPKNFTGKILHFLDDLGVGAEVSVVLGSANKHQASLVDWKRKKKTAQLKITFHRHLQESEMVREMAKADVVFSPTSGTALEVCSLGVPLILGQSADNQTVLAQFLEERQVGKFWGKWEDCLQEDFRERFHRDLQAVLTDSALALEMVGRQKALIDGQSGKRILQIFQDLSEG